MEWWQAIILGAIEGLTEYLPVSSTGHLLLVQRLLGLEKGVASDAYAIVIQAGAILAVMGLYWRRMKQMSLGLLGRDDDGFRLAINIVTAFAATVISYKLAEKLLEKTLYREVKDVLFHLPHVSAAWIVGGVAILAVVYLKPQSRVVSKGREIDQLTVAQALLIGVLQALAVWPGTSRSLVTIVAGVLVGLSVSAAVEFSFLLGVLTLLAATAMDINEHGQVLRDTYSLHTMILGVVTAGLFAALAVKWMVTYLRGHSLAIFGWYRVGLGLLVVAALLLGWVEP